MGNGGGDEAEDRLVPAPAGTLVIRGGLLTGPSREKNLRDVEEAYGVWGICVKAEPGLTAEQIAKKAKLRGKTMMVGLAEELEEAGFRVVQEPKRDWPAALILFSDRPTTTEWDDLRNVLLRRPAEANPNGIGN